MSGEFEWRVAAAANHAIRNYSRSELLWRAMWGAGRWLIVLSPPRLFGWRRAVLRLFGSKVGRGVRLCSSTRICMPWNVAIGAGSSLGEQVLIYSLGQVTIGRGVTLARGAHICAGTHDFSDPSLPLLKPPVVLEDGVRVGIEAFIGPGVVVGAGATVGLRAVVVKRVAPATVVSGNPARPGLALR